MLLIDMLRVIIGMKYYDQMLIDLEKYREGDFYGIRIRII